MWALVYCCLLCLFCGVQATVLPSCTISDSKCLKTTAQSALPILIPGIPDIGAASLDPLHVDKIKVDLAGLKLIIRDADFLGLNKSIIDKISVDTSKKVLKLVYHSDGQLKGKYKASGKLLILPITGDGYTHMTFKTMEIQLSIPFDFKENADGATIMDLRSFSLKYNIKDGASFNFTNLFNGNKELSDTMLNFMNTSWKVLTEEFGFPILEAAHKVLFDSLKKFLATQPIANS